MSMQPYFRVKWILLVHSYKDNICVLSLLIILGRDDFSDWFPHFGPFEDGEAMFRRSEYIQSGYTFIARFLGVLGSNSRREGHSTHQQSEYRSLQSKW